MSLRFSFMPVTSDSADIKGSRASHVVLKVFWAFAAVRKDDVLRVPLADRGLAYVRLSI